MVKTVLGSSLQILRIQEDTLLNNLGCRIVFLLLAAGSILDVPFKCMQFVFLSRLHPLHTTSGKENMKTHSTELVEKKKENHFPTTLSDIN